MQDDHLRRQREILGVYQRVMSIIWGQLSPTFGIRTINAIARNVIARRAATYPLLAQLRVGPEGIEWPDFAAGIGQISEDELHAMLDEFLDDFLEALANLIGRLVVGKIFKEAEEMARKEVGE